jgi:hypothetical protein
MYMNIITQQIVIAENLAEHLADIRCTAHFGTG